MLSLYKTISKPYRQQTVNDINLLREEDKFCIGQLNSLRRFCPFVKLVCLWVGKPAQDLSTTANGIILLLEGIDWL